MGVDEILKKIEAKAKAKNERKNLKIKLGNLRNRSTQLDEQIKKVEEELKQKSIEYELGKISKKEYQEVEKKLEDLKDEKRRVIYAIGAVCKMIDEKTIEMINEIAGIVRDEWRPYYEEAIKLALRLKELRKLQDIYKIAYSKALMVPSEKNILASHYWVERVYMGTVDDKGNPVFMERPAMIDPNFRVPNPFADCNVYSLI